MLKPLRVKLYLAARYSRHPEMREYREQLKTIDVEVTSRWIDCHGGKWLTSITTEQLQAQPSLGYSFAMTDLEDINKATSLVVFNEAMAGSSKGGRHVEYGYALGKGKPVDIIGPRENVFYCLDSSSVGIYVWTCWEDFYSNLKWKLSQA